MGLISAPEKMGNRCHRATGLQRAMVLASLKHDGPQPYQQQLVITFHERLDPIAFIRATEICLTRHAGLMAGFEFHGHELFQRRRDNHVGTKQLDLSGEPGGREERFRNFLARDADTDLPVGTDQSAWRSTLLTLGPHDLVWVWSHHHALCDAASYPILLREILTAYDAIAGKKEVEQKHASPDFLDHLAWLEKQDWSAREAEWRHRFSVEDAPTQLPRVRRSLSRSFSDSKARIQRAVVPIEPKLQARIAPFCVAIEVTPNILLLAAWSLWLARVQDERAVIFGVMRAARKSSIAQADSAIGLFANTLPIRIEVPENLSVGAWLRKVRQQWNELRDLEQCSLAQVAGWTGLELGAEGLPALVNFQRVRLEDRLREVGVNPARWEAQLIQSTDIPLILNGYEAPHLQAEFVWQSDKSDDAMATFAAEGVSTLLEAITRDPQAQLASIEITTEEDRRIAGMANGSLSSLDVSALAHDKIDNQITAHPEAVAFRGTGREVSYRKLDGAAKRIHVSLNGIGKSEDIVALILPAGPEIACAMLGILRAGRAFFIINPSSRAEERTVMLRRCGAVAAIVTENLVAETAKILQHVFVYDAMVAAASANALRTPVPIKPTDLAYVVQTSGSTGNKKFVEIEHRSLANALDQLTKLFDLDSSDRRIARALPGADYFISETLVTLSAGATLIFPEQAGPMSVRDFLSEIRKHEITVTGIPASFWHEWVSATDSDGGSAIPPSLKLVITGMEKINPELLEKWQRIAGKKVRWLNVYGPAETTLIATAFEGVAKRNGADVSIGKALGNTLVYVLDHGLRRVPVGVTGEICIAGLGVARGYRGDAEATRAKFVANPYDDSAEFSRLYRTGDYGHVDEAGHLVFLGRRDFQIKMRGHRIELGEIEATLERNENVRRAIVTVHNHGNEQWLVAHLTVNRAQNDSAIGAWLREKLAPQFQPAAFVIRDQMPLLPSGKIDRQTLASDYASRLNSSKEVVEAATPIQAMLQRLWKETLGCRASFNCADNFFDAGGDSLSAVRLLCRIEEEFDVDLSMHDLLTHPTIDLLSRLLKTDEKKTDYTSLISLNSGESGTPLFIAHGWSGSVFHCIDFARRLSRPVYGLNAVELAGVERHESFEEMACHYANEIGRERPTGPIDLFGYSVGGIVAYAIACELIGRGREVKTLFIVDTIPPNLPMPVYLRFLAPYLKRRIWLFVNPLLRTRLRFWPRHIRRRMQLWLAKRRALANSSAKHPPNIDYYYFLGTKFLPRRVPMNICLLTSDSKSVAGFWKYLAHNPVQVIQLRGGHVDIFNPPHLENFLDAFQRAIAAKEPRPEVSAARAHGNGFDYLET